MAEIPSKINLHQSLSPWRKENEDNVNKFSIQSSLRFYTHKKQMMNTGQTTSDFKSTHAPPLNYNFLLILYK